MLSNQHLNYLTSVLATKVRHKNSEQDNFIYLAKEFGEYAKALVKCDQQAAQEELIDLIIESIVTYKAYYGSYEAIMERKLKKWNDT